MHKLKSGLLLCCVITLKTMVPRVGLVLTANLSVPILIFHLLINDAHRMVLVQIRQGRPQAGNHAQTPVLEGTTTESERCKIHWVGTEGRNGSDLART